ncbi:hypothetical protein [Sphingobacterium siyangense]
MDKLFGNHKVRKQFLYFVISILILLLIIRFLGFPIKALEETTNKEIISFIDKFVTSIITALIVGYFIYKLQIDEKKKSLEFTSSSPQIEDKLDQARNTCDSWKFSGGLGRYTRYMTLPELSNISSKKRETYKIELIILNPENDILLQKYADFRNNVNHKANWNIYFLRKEILATIYSAVCITKTNQFLEIDIFIKDFFTLSRMDISNETAIISREDPLIPTIICYKESYLFKHYKEEFQQVKRQSKKIDLYNNDSILPDIENLELLSKKLFPSIGFSKIELNDILEEVKKTKNPFKK